jgi:hypothetical protein
MLKRIVQVSLVSVLLSLFMPVAHSEVYVKVDANGNAIGGAIICDSGTCGPGSLYSQLTLQPGERYVLQGTGQAGIGNNNPGIDVKVDLETNVWTVTDSKSNTVVQQFTPQTSPGNDRPQVPPTSIQDTQSVTTDTGTVTTDTGTVSTKVDTSTTISIRETVTISSIQDTQTINSVVASLSVNEKEEQLQIDLRGNKSTLINVSTEFAGAPLKITATRQGYKSITINLRTDLDGNAQLNSSRNLRGFTVVLSIGKVKLDTDLVRK